jgi:Leucine-rich repeat (LRR) protein
MDDIEQVKIVYPITELTSCSFSNYSSLISIELPFSLKTIKDFAFSNCYSLSGVKLGT